MGHPPRFTSGWTFTAAPIRLAAVSADELLDEHALPYDPDAVVRAVERWPRVRCCYEAGTDRVRAGALSVSVRVACDVVAPGLVSVMLGDRIKIDPHDARKLARLHAGGLLETMTVPCDSGRGVARSSPRA